MSEKLYHGACYYPELWDEKTIEEDIGMMKETGINAVRMGEFAWSYYEPEEGKINVSFFENIIDKLYKSGIDTIMCTPTPTPPIWLTHGHRERLFIDQNGTVMGHGSRQHVCTNNPYFRQKAAIITEQIAKAVGQHPGVIAWQLDNEWKCHVNECMCETCKTLWHEWLKQRYGSIDHLNEAWGTHIWSEYYQSFEQVPQPLPTPFLHNSSLKTMYQLFSMEKIAEFADEQAAIIRKYSKAPITHNSSIAFQVDNERLFQNLDFASFDTYATVENFSSYLLNCDLYRNFKRGKKFWIMETSPSYAASLESYAPPHPDGYLKAEAVAAYALGSASFCYWLWRQQKTGSEQPHGSVISAWGKPTIGYRNVLEVEKARKAIESIILPTKLVPAEVAMFYSDRAKAFFMTEPHRKLNHRELVTTFYQHILTIGVHRDLIPEGASLDGYKIVFSPFIPYLSDEYLQKMKAFVEAGGIWIVGPLSGGRTEEHTIHTDRALGKLEELAGIETLYTFPLDGTGTIGRAFGVSAPLSLWSAVFETKPGQAVGIIEDGLAKGKAFITESEVGKGRIVLLGSMPAGAKGKRMIKNLMEHYVKKANVTVKAEVSPGTIVVPRERDGHVVLFIVNMNGKGGSAALEKDGIDLLTEKQVKKGKLDIDPFEYKIIQLEK